MPKILPYVLIALIVGAFAYQTYKISDLSEELGKSNQTIKVLEDKQKSLSNDLQQYKIDKQEFDSLKKSIISDNRKIKDDLNNKKGREEPLIKKSSLVEKQINESFKKAANALSCTTGATERCEQQ